MITEELLAEWKSTSREDKSLGRRMFEDLPIELRVGRDSQGRPMVAVQCGDSTINLPKVEGLSVNVTQASNQRQWLVVALERNDALEEFSVLCDDLIDEIRGSVDQKAALQNLIGCLERWRRLFLPMNSDLLSETLLRSIFSELAVLFFQVYPLTGDLSQAIQSWKGPFRAPQDFVLDSFQRAIEVKSLHRDKEILTVSSIEQLDSIAYSVELAIVKLEKVAPDTEGCISLIRLIRFLIREISGDLEGTNHLIECFHELGFDPLKIEYSNVCFSVDSITTYEVSEGFPCLRRSSVPSAITKASYELSVPEIADFFTDEISPISEPLEQV